MSTHRIFKTAFVCCLLVGLPSLGETQSIRAAAVGFQYPTMSELGVKSPTQEPACTTNHLAGAAIGLVAGAVLGTGVGVMYALTTVLIGPRIPIQAFILVGAGAGAIRGATLDMCARRRRDE
jgi:hypothetical protein